MTELTCPPGATKPNLPFISAEQAKDILEILREQGLFQQFTVKAEGHGPWTHVVEVFGGPHSHWAETKIRNSIATALSGFPAIIKVRMQAALASGPSTIRNATTLF